MFETVARRLLAGDFLCPYASPELHAWLLDEAARAEIDAWLARIGLQLALTRQGTAFYAAHASIGSEERHEAAEAFREVQQQLRPMVNFLVLAMRATQDDSVLMPGSLLEAAALHAAIDASPNLDEVFDRAELLRLHTLTDNRYADVRTLAEKQRQNAFWLRRIERIGRWRLIRSAGRALPQEAFIEPEHTAQAGTAQASLPRLPASSDG